MKRYLLAFSMLFVTAGAANAGGLVTRHQSSLQHTVDAARTTTSRIGNSYSVSGSGVVTDVGGTGTADLSVGGLGTLTNGAAGGSIPTATQSTSGNAFSFSNSFTAGDATNSTGTNSTAYTAGSAGDYSGGGSVGTIDNKHTLTITGTSQGAGTSVTAQFVTELTIID